MRSILKKIFNGAINLLSYVIVSATLFSAYGGIENPNDFAMPSFAVMIFPFILAICIIMLVVDIILRRKIATLLIILALLICSEPIYDFFPLNISGKSKAEKLAADKSFKVVTYNVCNFDDLTRDEHDTQPGVSPSLSYIIASGADVVCLQECVSLTASRKRDLFTPQMDSLYAIYPYIIIDNNFLTVLSRTPIEQIDMPITEEFTFATACYHTKIDNHDVSIINLHLQSIGLDADDKELYREITNGDANRNELKDLSRNILGKLKTAFMKRANEANEVRQFINNISGNIIVCGDFNDVPGCYALRTVQGRDLKNAYTDGALGPCWTYNSDRFLFRIDHILYRGDMKAVYTLCDDNRGSDHYPLMTTFEWIK